MRFGLDVINAYPASFYLDLAREADRAGWQGIFIWDHVTFGGADALEDPWVLLGAMAAVAPTLTLGSLVTPLARRRPHLVAKHMATLDALTGGRAVLGVGLGGVEREFSGFGENADPRKRAARLDEALALIDAYWSGRAVHHDGAEYRVDGMTLLPRPVQRPRIPVWVGGDSRAAIRRAARWDGWAPTFGAIDRIIDGLTYLRQVRTADGPFDIVYMHDSRPAAYKAGAIAQARAAGITWWLDALHGHRFRDSEAVLDWVRQGPPGT